MTLRFILAALFCAVLPSCGSSSSNAESQTTDTSQVPTDGEKQEQGSEDAEGNDKVIMDGNKLGAWIFYIDEPGLIHNNHQDMANYLADMGVKRVFIKISDINYQWQNNKISFTEFSVDCGVWQDACDPSNLEFYKQKGLEVWAWTYNDTHSYEEQADMLEAAIKVGYDGFVLDIEVEFDGDSESLKQLLEAHKSRFNSLANSAPEHFKLAATTWGNPKDHDMNVALIDQYVDAHIPQTYIEKWGADFIADIAGTINIGDCEYRELGATKPIWHIISHEDKLLTAQDFNTFIQYAGPNASVWRISDSNLMTEASAIDWGNTSFQSQACSQNNFEL
ncbi:MAG: hypothetical protein HWE10_14595 [Gammaproteobacteria bacterium]|nr:hypothetical protein [Gammaproteobacteria bacterium]